MLLAVTLTLSLVLAQDGQLQAGLFQDSSSPDGQFQNSTSQSEEEQPGVNFINVI